MLNVGHLKADDATANEQEVYNAFLVKASEIFATIKNDLLSDTPTAYKDLEEEYQAYESYIVNNMLMSDTGILDADAIDKTDLVYKEWTEDETISLKEFLTYAIQQNWLDITKITSDTEYMDTDEMFTTLADYISNYLYDDDNFCKQVYRYLLKEERINEAEICLLLFDQGVLDMDTTAYQQLSDGSLSGFDFIYQKIYNLEIRPSQLALNPCSGSLVLTDPNNGETLACVTYPGYDNNRLANEMDSDYFTKLNMDKSSPFYSRATQEAIAPGSTFKIVTATAGYMEGVINLGEGINCTGKFDTPPFDEQPINCWNIYGHGVETLQTAIRDSCNYFFSEMGFRLSLADPSLENTDQETYVEQKGVDTIRTYAAQFGLDRKTGIQLNELEPHISDTAPIPSAIGQGTHAFSNVQLARYATTIANSGTVYDLTLLDKLTDSDGNLLEKYTPTIVGTTTFASTTWDTIHDGMRSGDDIITCKVDIAGKTGTAEESKLRPNHANFISYAPYDNPEIAVVVSIPYGYTSSNAARIASNIYDFYYGELTLEEIQASGASKASTAVVND